METERLSKDINFLEETEVIFTMTMGLTLPCGKMNFYQSTTIGMPKLNFLFFRFWLVEETFNSAFGLLRVDMRSLCGVEVWVEAVRRHGLNQWKTFLERNQMHEATTLGLSSLLRRNKEIMLNVGKSLQVECRVHNFMIFWFSCSISWLQIAFTLECIPNHELSAEFILLWLFCSRKWNWVRSHENCHAQDS